MRKPKLSKEIRLAYLIHRLYERLCQGKCGVTTWYRRYRLVLELERTKDGIDGYLAGAA